MNRAFFSHEFETRLLQLAHKIISSDWQIYLQVFTCALEPRLFKWFSSTTILYKNIQKIWAYSILLATLAIKLKCYKGDNINIKQTTSKSISSTISSIELNWNMRLL